MNLGDLLRGDTPLVIDIPHAGTHLPAGLAERLTPAARALPDTDWHVEKLFAFAREASVTMLAASRTCRHVHSSGGLPVRIAAAVAAR